MDVTTRVAKMIDYPSFWTEISLFLRNGGELKFSPWGMATVAIPPFFKDCMARATNDMNVLDFQYQDACGTEELRKSICAAFSEFTHFPSCDPKKNISVGSGAMGVMDEIIKSNMVAPDDEIITFDPIYPYHFQGLRQRGTATIAKTIFNEKTRRFEFDFDDFKAKLSPKTKLLVLCNPHNPLARIWSAEEYQKLTDILEEYPHVKIAEDCAYAVYINSKTPLRYFHEFGKNFNKTYTVFSAGKIFNTTGNRIGWFIGPEHIVTPYKEKIDCYIYPSAVEQRIYQYAFLESMKPYQGFANFWEFHADDNIQRMNYLIKGLDKLGIEWLPSEGTYYITISAEKLAAKIEPEFYQTYGPDSTFDPSRDAAVCRKLFLKHSVGCMPYSKFMLSDNKCDGWIRVSFNRSYEDLDFFLGQLSLILKGN